MERVGSEYVLNGEKTSISAADQADATVVFARSRAASRPARAGFGGARAARDRRHHPHPFRLPRPARHRPRLAVLRGRARAGRSSAGRGRWRLRAGHAGLRLRARADRPAGARRRACSLEETWAYVAGARPSASPCLRSRASRIRSPASRRRSKPAPALSADALAEGPRRAAHSEAAMCKWLTDSRTTRCTPAC